MHIWVYASRTDLIETKKGHGYIQSERERELHPKGSACFREIKKGLSEN